MDAWSSTSVQTSDWQERSTSGMTDDHRAGLGAVGRVLGVFTSRRPNMTRTKRVNRRLCQGLGLVTVWCAAIKVFMLLLVVDPKVLKENLQATSVSLKSEGFRRQGEHFAKISYASDSIAKGRTQTSGEDVSSALNNTYSSLALDDLKTFHLQNGPQIILERSPQHFNFIITESDICEKKLKNRKNEETKKSMAFDEYTHLPGAGRPQILAVAVVSSSLRNWRERQFVRATWGHPDIVRISGIPVVFLVGSTSSSRGQQSLVKESLMFRDIVQADFLDSYNNLSLKSMAGMSWAAEHCKQANWVFKTDDDMCINVFDLKTYLVSFLRTRDTEQPTRVTALPTKKELLSDDQYVVSHSECVSSRSTCILCDKVTVSAPVETEKNGLNGVSPYEWAGSKYPPYCNGVGFLIPQAAVGRMVEASRHTRLLRVEDVFMTGVLARAAGLRVHRIHDNSPWLYAMNAQSKVDTFLNASRLTLELDRDLEFTNETPGGLWRKLLKRHGLEALGNTVP